MRGRRIAIGVLALIAVGAGSWSLYHFGALKAPAADRLAAGLAVGVTLLAVVPVCRPRRPGRPEFEHAGFELAARWPPAPEDDRPVSLREIEFAVRFATLDVGSYELHYRLRPILRDLAEYRLRRHELVDLDSPGRAAAARALLGEDLWEVVRADRPVPADRRGPGISVADAVAFVERLESL
jgi:hypothetical protein